MYSLATAEPPKSCHISQVSCVLGSRRLVPAFASDSASRHGCQWPLLDPLTVAHQYSPQIPTAASNCRGAERRPRAADPAVLRRNSACPLDLLPQIMSLLQANPGSSSAPAIPLGPCDHLISITVAQRKHANVQQKSQAHSSPLSSPTRGTATRFLRP